MAALNGAIVDGRKITAAQARPYQGSSSGIALPHRNRGSSDKIQRVPENSSSYEHSSGTVPPPAHNIHGGGNDFSQRVPEDSYDQ